MLKHYGAWQFNSILLILQMPSSFYLIWLLFDLSLLNIKYIYGQVRIEAALTLRALAEVDPTCVGGLISYGVTTLTALRENVSFEKVQLINYMGNIFVLLPSIILSICLFILVLIIYIDFYNNQTTKRQLAGFFWLYSFYFFELCHQS